MKDLKTLNAKYRTLLSISCVNNPKGPLLESLSICFSAPCFFESSNSSKGKETKPSLTLKEGDMFELNKKLCVINDILNWRVSYGDCQFESKAI